MRTGIVRRIGAASLALDAVGRAAVAGVRPAVDLARWTLRAFLSRPSSGRPVTSLSEPDALATRRGARRAFDASGIIAAGLIACIIGLGSHLGPAGTAATAALTVYALTLAARASLAHWQAGRRGSGSLREWVTSEPIPAGGAVVRAVPWILACSALIPATAAAAGIGGADALTERWLAAALPLSGPFGAALSVLTSSLIAVAATMLSWQTVAAMVSAAHEGRLVGNRYHMVWAPVRVTVGIGLLAPVIGGFSTGHVLLAEATRYGSGLATEIWSEFVGTVARGDVLAPPASTQGLVVARQVLEHEVCVGVARNMLPARYVLTPWRSPPPEAPPAEGIDAPAGRLWDWSSACGTMLIPAGPADETNRAFAQARREALAGIVADIRASGLASRIADVASPGRGDGQDWPMGTVSVLASAASRYDATMSGAARAFVTARSAGTRDRLITAARDHGWPSAGLYWRTLADLSAETVIVAAELPQRTGPTPRPLGSSVADTITGTLDKIRTQLEEAGRRAPLRLDDLAAAGDGQSNMLARILAPLSRAVAESALSSDAGAGGRHADPVGSLMQLGHALLTGTQATIVAGTAVAIAAGNGVGFVAGLATAFDWVKEFLAPSIFLLIAVGYVLAYVLPILPYLSVLWLLVGWLVFLLETIVALPIWLLLWCRMDGAEIVDNPQRPGMIILFNLFLRPSLGVLALCGVYYVLPLAVGFLHDTWSRAYLAQQGGHVVGLVGLVGGLCMLAYLSYQVTARLCALPHEIPDRIGRWFGASAEGLGESEGFRGATAAGIGGATTAAGSLGRIATKRNSPNEIKQLLATEKEELKNVDKT